MPTIPTPLTEEIMISVYLKRDTHDNGMTLQQYADGIMAGTQPILDHDAFVYQFGAPDDALNLVVDWANANNLTIVEAHHGTATVKTSGTADQFNKLFNVVLQTVTDTDRTYITHDGTITVPTEIDDVVELVLGLDNSGFLTHNAIIESDSTGLIDPNLVSSPTPVDHALAYKFPRTYGSNQKQGLGACIGILELGGGYTAQNLSSTFGRIGLTAPTVVDYSVDSSANNYYLYDPSGANAEVVLDIYCAGAVAPGAKQVIYFAPNTFMSFINAVLAAANDTVNNPSVLSISWGTQDSYFNGYFGLFEPAFQTAVARGLTVFVSTGDYGVKATPSSPTYSLDYPSSSPYVVASGGTVISINNDYSIASETAWGTAGGTTAGGGGVSSIFSVPSWQSGLTTMTYPGSTVATISGRATPDVSAMATGYAIYWYNFTTTGTAVTNVLNGFVGTSAVAPLLAGMMARLNQASGKRIGFVNADWYSNRAACFNDITTGDNHGPNTVGYRATGSWDAATGLGSPVGTSLYNLYNVGTTFPKLNYGFRPKSGSAYPRNLPNAR